MKLFFCILFLLSFFASAKEEKKDISPVPFGLKSKGKIIGQENGTYNPESKTLKIQLKANEVGSSAGYNIRGELEPSREMTMSYEVKFASGVDFGKGGKLPGLCGGKSKEGGTVTGQKEKANGTNGFSVRPMWLTKGRVCGYSYYLGQKKNSGTYFAAKGEAKDSVKCADGQPALKAGEWSKVEISIKLGEKENIGKDRAVIKVNGALVMDQSFTLSKSDKLNVDTVCFDTFRGGGRDWAISKSTELEIKNFSLKNNFTSVSPTESVAAPQGPADI